VEEQRRVEIFSFEHGLDVKDFVNRYMGVVRDALDALWGVVRWEMRGSFWVPSLKGLKQVERMLRSRYLRDWPYSQHYVKMAVRSANAIIESWGKKYLKGEASKEKPTPTGNYVKIRWPFFNYKDGILTIPIKPNGECISIDLKNTPFWDRISGSKLVEVRLEENKLTVITRRDIKA
jgi:putative transposase